MRRKLGACIVGADEKLWNHVESNSLKKLSVRLLILSGGTATPRGGRHTGGERLERILAFSRVKDLPSP